jgi:polyisoprenoid-binding protein YceI
MKNRILMGGVLAGVLAIAAAVGVWYFVIRSDSPPPVSLEAALDAASSTPAAGSSSASNSGATTTSDASGNLEGTWTLVGGGSSFAGYRVQEELVGIGSTVAVGRTTAVTGSLEYNGEQITKVEVTADLSKLASDKPMRDGQLRNQAIEYAKFPTATFALTSPISIAEEPEAGETVKQTVKGNLTLHGVTKPIEMDVEGVIKDGKLVVVGSTVIQFADYNISQPSGASVLSIDNKGTMELQLIFQHA